MGLLNQNQPATPGLDPQKKQLLERSYQVGKNIIYDREIFGHIVQQVDNANPADALADAIVIVLSKIQDDPSIGQLPLDVALGTGLALLSDLVDALTQTGRKYDQNVIQQALQKGTQLYLHMNGSRINPQELQSQMAQLQSFLGGK